jgi:hypothetical protein
MQRVLDLDLDAFVYGSEDGRTRDDPRLDAEVHPPWDLTKVLSFLRCNCRLSGPLPGFAVEHHGDLFFRWRDAIEEGLLDPGFHVTHVDAHADLGTGDCGFDYLLTEFLHEPAQNRHSPKTGDDGLGDGNYLAFATANPTLEPRNLRENLGSTDRLRPLALEPPVPFDWLLWHEYEATEPFDLICLARSPSFTPAAADALYDEIRSRFIDENAMACLR